MSIRRCYWPLILTAVIDSAYLMHMTSKGQMMIVKSGESVRLECHFVSESFSLFENPIVWRKAQRQEETQINMMGNLMEPFASAKRFRSSFQSEPPKFFFGLTITNVSLEDNGNYTCHISGPHNAVLSAVTHYIFVTAPIDHVIITDDNSTQLDQIRHQSLTYAENRQGLLRCIALGGSPPPEIHIYLGEEDITGQFGLQRTPTLSRRKGLRLVYYTTERSTQQFRVQPEDDGKMVKCVVSVPGSPSNYSLARITVHYAALIRCDETESFNGERNVFLRCEIRSKPRPDAIFWIINSNGTAVAEGDVVDGYWTLVMDRTDDVLETQLFIKQTSPVTFRRYTLVIQNTVDVRTTDVELRQKFPTTSRSEVAKPRDRGSMNKQESMPRGLISNHSHPRLAPLTFAAHVFIVLLLAKLVFR